eukprot:1462932-Rhodomonas_salina.1
MAKKSLDSSHTESRWHPYIVVWIGSAVLGTDMENGHTKVSMIQEVHAKRMTVGDDVVHDKKMRSQHVDQLFSDLMQSAYNRIH